MGFLAKFKRNKNRTFAIGFSGLGLLFFFLFYGISIGLDGVGALLGDPSSLINAVITAIIYFMIFIYNCNNDSRAFGGVSWFLFVTVFNQVLAVIMNVLFGGIIVALVSPLALLHLAFLVGQAVVGILLYIRSRGYMRFAYSNFKRIRLLFILFLIMLFISEALLYGPLLLEGSPTRSFLDYLLLLALPLSEMLVGLSCAFTMERLRRY